MTFEGENQLLIDIPQGDFLLSPEVPRELAGAIAGFTEQYPQGLVAFERIGPEVTTAASRHPRR